MELSTLVDQAASVYANQIKSGRRPGEAGFVSTRVFASFHSDQGFDGAIDSTPDNVGGTSDAGAAVYGILGAAQGDGVVPQPARIVGLTTQKRFGSSAGTFTLTLKARNGTDVLNLWEDPEDVWVRIVVMKDGEPVEVVFGLIDTVTEGMTRAESGARSAVYTVTGRDWHKVFATTQLYINVHMMGGVLPTIPLYDPLALAAAGGSPSDVVGAIMDAWLGNGGVADKQWILPKSLGGGFLYDMVRKDFQRTRGLIKEPGLYNPDMGSTLWSVLEEYSNGVLNELYTTTNDTTYRKDSRPRPVLRLRERPFPTKDKSPIIYDSLISHILQPGDVKDRNMTKGAPESRYNYWLLDAQGLLGDGFKVQQQIQFEGGTLTGEPGAVPIFNINDIRKHGLRRFTQASRFMPFREDATWFQEAARWIHMLHDWYGVAPFEVNGTIVTTSMLPKIRIGECVVEQRSAGPSMTYYVEGVTHEWQYPNAGRTTLNLTRGEANGRPLLDILYEHVDAGIINMAEWITGLPMDGPLASYVPTGSGPRLDRLVGQLDTPERLFMRSQGALDDSGVTEQRDEPQNPQEGTPTPVSPGDLPDQQVSEELDIQTGAAQPTSAGGGNLTKRQLEAGIPLPEQEQNVNQPETSEETLDQKLERWRQTRYQRRPV